MLKGIIANPNIAPHIKQNIKALHQHKMLYKFCTTFYYHTQYPLAKILGLLSKKLNTQIKRRSIDDVPYQLIHGKPLFELIRIFLSKFAGAKVIDAIWEISEHSFDQWVSRKITNKIDFVLVCEHSSLKTLLKAQSAGVKTFYEQPSVHYSLFSKIIIGECQKYPQLVNESIKLTYEEKSKRRNLRRDQELNLADFIICNSSFTKNSLIAAGIPNDKLITIPLGFPEALAANDKLKQEKFIFMYAGNITLNKGIHILIEAWSEIEFLLKESELHLYGTYYLPILLKDNLPKNIHFKGNIPHTDLIKIYSTADVFVNPTLADGFGMVIAEAMANGLPVIASKNSAGPDLIKDNLDGMLINAGDKEDLKAKMIWCYENQNELSKMGLKAAAKAKSYTWQDYRNTLANTIKNKLGNV